MPEPRILLFDTENAPNLGYVWGKWEQNVIDFRQNWYFLSFAYRWLGEKKTTVCALPDYPRYDAAKECDKALVKDLWRVLDEADICVAHNGDRFDLRKANARFVVHGLPPPSPHKSVDTLKLARKHFQFDSNKLDDLGQYLGVGRKLPNTGKHLWFGCMQGDPKAWGVMRRYNAQDVELLERIYLKLRPWASNHPNLSFYTGCGCPVCQSKRLEKSGWNYARTGKRQRMLCLGCGHRFSTGGLIRA